MISHRHLRQASWIIFFTFGQISNATAYQPEFQHAAITEAAFTLYAQCSDPDRGDNKFPHPDALGVLQKANQSEDGITLRRAFNWHFYDPEGPTAYRAGEAIPWLDRIITLKRVFGRIVNELAENERDYEDTLKLIGRALHYVEDMSVPAHVIPVYHGPKIPGLGSPQARKKDRKFKDYLKSIFVLSDTIDRFPVQASHQAMVKALVKAVRGRHDDDCQSLKPLRAAALEEQAPPATTLWKILLRSAQTTRDRLREEICPSANGMKSPTWSQFWNYPEAGSFFGRYPSADKQFGTPQTLVHPSSGNSCEVGEVEFKRFVHNQHIQAVEADLKVLFLLDDLIRQNSPTDKHD